MTKVEKHGTGIEEEPPDTVVNYYMSGYALEGKRLGFTPEEWGKLPTGERISFPCEKDGLPKRKNTVRKLTHWKVSKMKTRIKFVISRLKRRMPTFGGVGQFWRPTECLMCRSARIAVISSIGWALDWIPVAIALAVALYFGLRPESNN
jgi:hypothetical protein